jgi:hypothetical protein
MKDGNGQTIAVALGGEAKGIEIWNPSDGSSKVLSTEVDSEVGSTHGLMYASLSTVNNGKDVIIFGGKNSLTIRNKVWKYNLVSNYTWQT